MSPTDQAVTGSGLLGNPVVVTLLVFLVIAGLVGDVAGKWTGPVTAVKAWRDARRPPPPPATHADELDSLRAQHAKDLGAVREEMAGLVEDVRRLRRALDGQSQRLDEAQEREETRDRLAAEHRQWDVAVVNKLIDLGVTDMPDPPPLHVHPNYTPRETQ